MPAKSATPPVFDSHEMYKYYMAKLEAKEQERLRQENLLEIRLRESSAKDERSNEIAQNMKAKGFELSLIAEVTGFSEWEIENFPERSPH